VTARGLAKKLGHQLEAVGFAIGSEASSNKVT
jgi:hypothetical protein